MKKKKREAGVILGDGNTITEKDSNKKDKDPIKKSVSFKSIIIEDIQTTEGINLEYAIPPTAMELLYNLYLEDETIAGLIDKAANIASSEKIIFTGREAAVNKAQEIIKMCYMILKKVKAKDDDLIIKKKMMTNEFFKYLFTNMFIYNNAYFEVGRSIDGTQMAFVYKDPRYIRVLKDHLGYVELIGLNKYFYNNYSSDRRERNEQRLHYTKGYIKGSEPIPFLDKRELIQIRGYGNEYYGVSALYSVGTSSLMQKKAKELPVNLLSNGMLNTPIITFSGTEVTEANKKEINNKMKYKAVGHSKSGTPIILYTTSVGSEVKVTGMPKHEFDLEQVREMYKLGESNVIKRFGVPPEKLSLLEHSNKATITEADQIMVEEIINPLQLLVEFPINTIFQDDLKLDVIFKFKDKSYNMEKLARISKVVRGMSVNEIREFVLSIPKVDDPQADEILLSQTDRAMNEEPRSTAQKDRSKVLKDEIGKLMELRKHYER